MRPRYAVAAILVLALLALVPASAAGQTTQVPDPAAQLCAQERADLGKKAFRKRHGRKHAMRVCTTQAQPEAAAVLGVATQSCQDQLAASGTDDFLGTFLGGLTSTLENAMGACVAQSVDGLLNLPL